LTLQNDKNIKVLLAVWGENYVEDFLTLSFPTLLAPGNIPALTLEYNTRFVILTRANQVCLFEQNPAFQKLKELCEVEFIAIDELIVMGNYSTTVTLAYDLAIKQTGEQMLNTYFVFLVSDYIMADGSMQGLMRYIKKGYSGICAGNFQVIQENVEDLLLKQIDPVSGVLQIKPRDLLKQSFVNLHPIVIASMCDQSVLYNYHANRFFYRYDEEVMAGRFYLLHMLCIKPETTNYKIGASCDYSFIPEMCPSGNITIINDSDDYCVIEVQLKTHEANNVNWGHYNLNYLSKKLSEWTIAQHRENSKSTIYFHTRDLLLSEKAIIEEKLGGFIGDIASRLKKYPVMPYYNHPYWRGAIFAFDKQRLFSGPNDYDYPDASFYNYTSTRAKKIYRRLFGTPPKVFRWHFRFREYQAMLQAIKGIVGPKNQSNTVVLYDSYQWEFMCYCQWMKDSFSFIPHYHLRYLITAKNKLMELKQAFDVALIFIRVDDIEALASSLPHIKKIIKPKGKVILIIPNNNNKYTSIIYDFRAEIGCKINTIYNANYRIQELKTITNTSTMLGALTIATLNRVFSYSKTRRFLSYIFFGAIGTFFILIKNSLPRWFTKNAGHCTHVIMTLAPNNANSEINQ
jgi:hypothetical protein